jgi:phosphate transport system substrate-binding protein
MRSLSSLVRTAAVGVAFAAMSVSAAHADTITGAGSTFIYPVLSQWAQGYSKATGTDVNYQAIGSGGGLKQLDAKTVTFAASDKPLSGDDLKSKGYVQWPMVAGAIVPVVNVPGISAGDMTLNGDVLAKIFMKKITKWNDPAILALNPSLKIGDQAITVVHRSDGSGTTFNFTDYLSKVSPEWKSEVGSSTEVKWPIGIGGKGNAGVAQYVQTVPGSIGYVEYAYATQNKLAYTKLVNANGKTVDPTAETFKAAAEGADYGSVPGYGLIMTNQPGDKSWPIMATTFVLTYAQPQDKAATTSALKFFDWVFKNGEADATKLDYLAMPEKVSALIEKTWANEIKDSGTAVWPAM